MIDNTHQITKFLETHPEIFEVVQHTDGSTESEMDHYVRIIKSGITDHDLALVNILDKMEVDASYDPRYRSGFFAARDQMLDMLGEMQ